MSGTHSQEVTDGSEMIKYLIRHEHLKVLISEAHRLGKGITEELFEKIYMELKHSNLIIAGDISGKYIDLPTVGCQFGAMALLFTDMDEFKRAFPDFDVEAHDHPFNVYRDIISNSHLGGYAVNCKSEHLILPKDFVEEIGGMEESVFSMEGSYDLEQIKGLRATMDNSGLEDFLKDPKNAYLYEELFARISESVMMVLMTAKSNLDSKAVNGAIPTAEDSKPLGRIYQEKSGGTYAAAFTSESRMAKIDTEYEKYSQIANFAYIKNFALGTDLDGIIINPGMENAVITRDVLLEYSDMIDETCNDTRLNSGVLHMFIIDEDKKD